MKKLTLEEVLARFIEKHKGRYTYPRFVYTRAITKSVITCSDHGDFLQSADSHLAGHGCPKCAGFLTTFQEILILFRNKHKDRYDYSKFVFIGMKIKGVIICRDHGEFMQSPIAHVGGEGCPKCSGKGLTIDELIEEFNKKHKNRYDYSKFIYVRSQTKGIIICKDHGEFLQSADNHKAGKGCPKCKSSRGEKLISEFLNSNDIFYERQKKFSGCVNVRQLPFDFYLPEHNLCIEFDGHAHYRSISHWGGESAFKNTQIRDSIKNQFCIDNNIRLLRIPYWDIDKIEQILKEFTWTHTIR